MHVNRDQRDWQGVPPFHIVAIGASAGGLRAAESFLDHTPPGSGMAYVLAFHLDPQHKSDAAALLQEHTAMPVVQVQGRTWVEPDHVYVIPPGHGLALRDGAVALTPLGGRGGSTTVIDRLFRSLARHAGERAIGVVLSGASLGATQGLKAIKEAGGLTLAQDPAEAEFAGMPHDAIATGLVDFVLPVARIPARLAAIKDFIVDLASPPSAAGSGVAELLSQIFVQLHAQVGHDFSHYKPTTVLRRIARRMQVRQSASLANYLALLRGDPAETEALFHDLLISVTRFFRDPEAMAILARDVVARLCKRATAGDALRVWIPGCASGEEAYTLAMLFAEASDELARPPPLQIFASDVDEHALALARRGAYPEVIADDVSAPRLRRFFDHDGTGYVVKPALREAVFFTSHDLLRDPPFSRLDLISCRNLLIYLDSELQKRVLALFHFALRPQAYLFLGSSESLGDSARLFAELDRGARLFQARSVGAAERPLALLPRATSPAPARRVADEPRRRFGDIARTELLTRYAPPCVIVAANYQVTYVSGRVGKYLEPGPGAVNYNVLDMARSELRRELRSALYRAFHDGASVQGKPVRLQTGAGDEVVKLTVRPLAEAKGHALVVFEMPDGAAPLPDPVPQESADLVAQLEAELTDTRESLQSTIEQLETSNEELRTSNEEMQSVNEELQSTTEELESGREELQSTNEELQAVNQELQARNDELARANADLDNLIASIGIATLFLDSELRVRRYTPRALGLFNLIASDIGRPLAHITHRLQAEDLVADAARVLESQAPQIRELASSDGRFFQTRIEPYRVPGNQVGGVLLSFVDVSERHQHEEETRALNARLQVQRKYAESIVATVREPMLVLDGAQHVVSANPAYYQAFHATAATTESAPLSRLAAGAWAAPELQRLLQTVLDQDAVVQDFEVRRDPGAGEGAAAVLRLNARRLRQEAGDAPLLLLAFEDVTQRLRTEAALREREDQKAYLLRLADSIRPLAGARPATEAAMGVLARQLGVDWAGYLELDSSGEFVDMLGNYAAGRPAARGRYRLRDFGPDLRPGLAAGTPYIVADTAALPISTAERAAYESRGCRATVGMPIIKGGRLLAVLCVSSGAPRAWQPPELALIAETAERTWEAIERARAEQALTRSEAKYRALFETMDEGFCILERTTDVGASAPAGAEAANANADFRWVECNAAFKAILGADTLAGASLRAHFPQAASAVITQFDQVLRSGQAVRFEQTLAPLHRTVEIHAFGPSPTNPRRVAVLFQDISARKRAEQRHQLLTSELNHRVRNNLAIVQTLATQTFQGAGCAPALAVFAARLRALAAAHDVLTRENWKGAEVSAIVQAALAAWSDGGADGRVRMQGPRLRLHATAALALALALHELATNASKYGALSNASGTVTVAWQLTAHAPARLRMTWREQDGPPVREPERRGFGSWLIKTGLAQDFGGTVELAFERAGVVCTIEAPLAAISEARA